MTTGATQIPSGKENTVKLHLGCYQKKIHGFVNVDIREDVEPDVVDDVFTLKKFNNNSADLILAVHVLEHLDRKKAESALYRWRDVLKDGGTLMVSVPDMAAVFEHYICYKDLNILQAFLGGSQKHEFDYHLSHFDYKTLKELLEKIGFKDIQLYDRWKTPWSYVDDYSAAYLPHMDFKKGKLMSLNISAKK
jgi:predicted SAM-dependent methyltransferase